MWFAFAWNMKIFTCVETLGTACTFRGFRGILSGHVSIGWIPDTFLFEVHSRRATRMDFIVEGWRGTTGEDGIIDVTNVLVHDSYFLAPALRPVTATATASFSISRPRNSKAAVIIQKAACRSQERDMGEGYVTLIQESCPCKWV